MRIRDNSFIRSVTQQTYAVFPNGRRDERALTFSLPQVSRMEDAVTPRFRARSKAGEVIVNPMVRMTSTSEAVSCPWWTMRTTPEGVYYNYDEAQAHTGSNDPVYSEPKVVDEILRQETLAVTEAYAGVGAADVSTLTELAELRETISFLLSPAKKLKEITARTASFIKRKRRFDDAFNKRLARWESRNPKRRGSKPEKTGGPTLKLGKFEATDISSAWLAYRYAIMPIIYTFQDIEKHLERSVYPTRVTSRSKREGKVDLATNPAWVHVSHSFGIFRYRHLREGSSKVACRAGVLYVADWSLQRQLGLQLHQLPASMYELIPLSFVADWFWNGSQAYQALTAELRSKEILGAWVTTTVDYDYVYRLECESLDASTVVYPGGQSMRVVGQWKRRRLVSLSDIGVRLKVDLNAKRVADALALSFSFLATARSLR